MTRLLTPQPARCDSPIVKATALLYLVFERSDLNKAQNFLQDFGLNTVSKTDQTLLMRGTARAPFCYWVRKGKQDRFIGFGLQVPTLADLNTLARKLGHQAPVPHPQDPEARVLVLNDPAGFEVHAVWGLNPCPELATRPPLPVNSPSHTPRINATQRSAEDVEVVRLGHVVLEVANYQHVSAWYTRTFGFIPSDVQVLPDGSPAVTFFRLDLGDTPTDHHTLAIAQGFMATYSHSAFELVDADAVGMGQRKLRSKGYSHAWGMGRHILGSQIFDYWNDPWGAKHEHYSDGDLFTAAQPTGIHPVSREHMAQWGQPMPASFTKPKMNARALRALADNLKNTPDLTLRKLATLARLFG